MSWAMFGIFFVVSGVCCCVGFKKFVWFLSVGYGLAVVGMGTAYLVTALVQHLPMNALPVIQCLLLMAYGARLSGFLLVREFKNGNYRKVLSEVTGGAGKPMPIFVKISVWVSVALLYIAQTSPVYFRLINGQGMEIKWPLLGVAISAAGLVIESLSDKQKSAQKAANPHMVATKGLFKFVRCPNYFGEIIFWTGMFVGGLNAYHTVGQWLWATLGYICIVFVMFNGAQRLDRRQEKNYGSKPEYRAYADHTPLILPFIPLYHLGKTK